MASSDDVVSAKIVVDSIHGDIHLTDREWRILDTMPFQRLRNLKHLGMAQLTFPNATHTRFAHCLGTLGIMSRILDAAKSNSYRLDDRQAANLRMAALLHDIGHYPYSHLMEGIDRVALTEEVVDGRAPSAGGQRPFDASQAGYPSHEQLGAEIVTNQEELTRAIGDRQRAQDVADLFGRTQAADPQLSKLLHSSFDMDRVDYLQRDSQATGVPYGNIDVNYLLNSLRISPQGMVGVSEKALPAAEQFLLARFFMHRVVYYHKTTYGFEEACRQLLRRIRVAGLFDMPADGAAIFGIARSAALATFTDAYVDHLVARASREGDGVMQALARCIENRRPPRLLKQVLVLEPGTNTHHAGTTFWLHAKSRLRALAESHNIPLGHFLLCKTKPFKLERAAMLTADQARALPPEEQDEGIKVFMGTAPEPVSLVDIKHSLINICSGRFFQAFRLYVVHDAPNSAATVGRMQEEVSTWGTAS